MKKCWIVLLVLSMLLSLVACGSEKTVSVYLLSEQKDYVDGELAYHFTAEYDDYGRPTVAKKDEIKNNALITVTFTYDEHGNRTQKVWACDPVGTDQWERSEIQTDYQLTYNKKGQVIRVDPVSSKESNPTFGYDVEYDSKGRLSRVDYDQPEGELKKNYGYLCWQYYTYDKDGRLESESELWFCENHKGEMKYTVERALYTYDEAGNLATYQAQLAYCEGLIEPTEQDDLEYLDHYRKCSFYYDGEGRLADVSGDPEYVYDGSSASLYSDPNYTFDDKGNLVRIQHDENTWTEYTYTELVLRESEAASAKATAQYLLFDSGICGTGLDYGQLNPVYWQIAPDSPVYYIENNALYYLVNNPVWG